MVVIQLFQHLCWKDYLFPMHCFCTESSMCFCPLTAFQVFSLSCIFQEFDYDMTVCNFLWDLSFLNLLADIFSSFGKAWPLPFKYCLSLPSEILIMRALDFLTVAHTYGFSTQSFFFLTVLQFEFHLITFNNPSSVMSSLPSNLVLCSSESLSAVSDSLRPHGL